MCHYATEPPKATRQTEDFCLTKQPTATPNIHTEVDQNLIATYSNEDYI